MGGGQFLWRGGARRPCASGQEACAPHFMVSFSVSADRSRASQRARGARRNPSSTSRGASRRVAGAALGDPRLAQLFDALDNEGGDLDAYLDVGAEPDARLGSKSPVEPARWPDCALDGEGVAGWGRSAPAPRECGNDSAAPGGPGGHDRRFVQGVPGRRRLGVHLPSGSRRPANEWAPGVRCPQPGAASRARTEPRAVSPAPAAVHRRLGSDVGGTARSPPSIHLLAVDIRTRCGKCQAHVGLDSAPLHSRKGQSVAALRQLSCRRRAERAGSPRTGAEVHRAAAGSPRPCQAAQGELRGFLISRGPGPPT